jgi:uncharacterized membrane protein
VALVVAVTVLFWVVLAVPVIRASPLRTVIGGGYALFVPGYAIVAALFPEVNGTTAEGSPSWSRFTEGTQLNGTDRLLLSVAVSIGLAPLVGLVLGMTTIGFRTTTLAGCLSLVTLLAVAVAVARRLALHPSNRFDVQALPVVVSLRRSFSQKSSLEWRTSWRKFTVNALVACSVLLAAGSVSYAIVSEPKPKPYTEFSVLAKNDSGEFVACEYLRPETGTLRPLRISATNRERERMNYTVIVLLQRVEPATDSNTTGTAESKTGTANTNDRNSLRPVEVYQLGRYDFTLAPGATWRLVETPSFPVDFNDANGTISTNDPAEYRLTYLLYRAQPPAVRTIESAYRSLWLDLTPDAATSCNTGSPTTAIFRDQW